MRALALAILLFAAGLGGCLQPSHDATAVPPSSSSASASLVDAAASNATAALPPRPVTLEFSDCLQLHTFFPFPIAVFTTLGFELPPGFQVASTDGATTKVSISWWSCPSGLLNDTVNGPFGPSGSMVIGVPVVPPADLAGRDPQTEPPQLDLLPLVWVLSNGLAAEFLDEVPGLAGGFVQRGDVVDTTDTDAGGVQARGMQAHASFGTFDVDAIYQSVPGDNPAGRYRLWLWPDGGDVTSYLEISNGAGKTLGSGYSDLRFNGEADTGAPPATLGESHAVEGTGVVIRVVQLP